MEEHKTPAIFLELRTGPEKGRRFELARHGNFLVGRAECAHFRLPQDDRRVSRLHFMLEFNPPLCRVLDMGSRNGTLVNGERVTAADLRDGDLVQAGRTRFRIRASAEPSPEPTPPQDTPPRIVRKGPAKGAPPAPSPLPVKTGGIGFEPTQLPLARDDAQAGPSTIPPNVPGYELIRELGQGGMGIVFLAKRLADGKELALKMIRPAQAASDRDLKLFLRESAILMQLVHPRIVSFREMGKGDGFAYFTMDYIHGRNAAQQVARQGPFDVARVLRIADQFLAALQHAHQSGFVHRDIKPSNLLLSMQGPEEAAYLADFGLARTYHNSPLSGLTMMGDVGGTIAFMAPEQVLDYRAVQPAADQYAAAATLYYLLTGGQHVHDFDLCAVDKCLIKKMLHPPVPLRERRADVPADLTNIIDRALAREPQDRFSDVQALREAILSHRTA